MTGRQRLNAAFERLGHLAADRAPWIIAGCLLVVGALATNLPNARIDTSNEAFLHEDDPTLRAYDAFREQFGRDELILITLEPDSVWDLDFLAMLRELHEELEGGVPHLEDITSLINARATRGREGELLVEDLMETWPETQEALDEIQAFARGNPAFENRLLSTDGRITAIFIETSPYSPVGDEIDFDSGFDGEPEPSQPHHLSAEENATAVAAVEEIVDRYRDRGVGILVAGSPVVTRDLMNSMQQNMLLFIRLTLLAIACLLFVLFRRVSAVFTALVVVVMSLVATISIMVATGTALTLPTMILPSFLLAVGVGDSVHILSLFYRSLDSGMTRRESIASALEHSGLPVTLTSLTTAGGLLSFAPAQLAPISDLGKFAPVGVMMAWLFSLLLLPAMLSVLPVRPRPLPDVPDDHAPRDLLDRVLARCAEATTRSPRAFVVGGVVLSALALLLASTVRFAHEPLEWLPVWSQARTATKQMDREMRGSITLEVILTREGENAWYDPDALQAVERASEQLEALTHGNVFIGKAFSAVDVLKEIHRALNENRDAFYAVPESRELIAQEFLLFENSGSDDLENLVDSQFSMLRLTLKAPFVDALEYTQTLEDVEDLLRETLPEGTHIELTGVMSLLFRTMAAVNVTMVRSYLIAFAVIAVLMVLMIGSVKLGLIAMFPNLLPIAMGLALMSVFDMPLDTFTLMIASISLGLAVDDTIHFMHNYRRYLDETGDSSQAVRLTLATTGRALIFTTLVLTCGFGVFAFAWMSNISNFGIITSFTISVALLADILLAPALLHWMHAERELA